MPSAATWVDLESVTLNEVSQIEKEKYDIEIYTHTQWNITQP